MHGKTRAHSDNTPRAHSEESNNEEDGHGDQGRLAEAGAARVYGAIGVRTDEAAAETPIISINYQNPKKSTTQN